MLRNYLASGNYPHAYLFLGPDGVGKYLSALNFAKAINCLSGETRADSCDSCPSCARIDKGQHPDIHLIEPGETDIIKIEAIRELKSRIALKPFEARKKVFIINRAQRLNAEASNALLKVLEEPPQDSLIILIAQRQPLLFKTVVSRCQALRFSALRREELREILEREYHADGPRAHYLAYFCEGRLGGALALLENNDLLERKNRVIDEFAAAGNDFSSSGSPERDKRELKSALNILASWFRDICMLKSGMAEGELVNFDRGKELAALAGSYSLPQLQEAFASISGSLRYLEQNINPKLLVNNLKAQLWRG